MQKNTPENPGHFYYDFKYGQQCHQVLSVIKDRLASSYNFDEL